MNSYVILAAFLSFAFAISAQALECGVSVDENKIILFVMTNPTYKELITAEKAACERGEKLIYFPQISRKKLQYFENLIEKKYLHKELIFEWKNHLNDLKKKNDPKLEEQIHQLNEKINLKKKVYEELSDRYSDRIEKYVDHPDFKPFRLHIFSRVDRKLRELDQTDVKVVSVILSGHGGDASLDGDLGKLDLVDLEILTKNHKSLQDFESLFILGCNTAGPSATMDIVRAFLRLNFFAGYADSAPLSMFEHNINYLYEMMLNESDLKSVLSLDILQSKIRNIKYIDDVFEGGAVVHENQIFLFYDSEELNEIYEKYNLDEPVQCSDSKIALLYNDLSRYYAGGKDYEPLEDPSSGRLKDLYVMLRQNESCYIKQQEKYGYTIKNGNHAGLLRFWRNVTLNFMQTFSKEFDEYMDSIDLFRKYNGSIWKGQYPVKNQMDQLSRERTVKLNVNLTKSIDAMEKFFLNKKPPSVKVNGFQKIKKFQKLWYEYIYKLNPDCMDFIEWHDFQQGRIKTGKCQY